jgi:hypothetical protein
MRWAARLKPGATAGMQPARYSISANEIAP